MKLLPEMRRRYSMLYGSEAKDLFKTLDLPLLPSVRINTLKTTAQELFDVFVKKRIDFVEIGDGEGARILKSPFSISSLEQHLYGHFYIQGVAEMSIAPQLGALPGELIWDMCAAPGGKTTHIAQLTDDKATIVATDVSSEKLKALKNNIARMGAGSTILYNSDARSFYFSSKFDRVLLDAPCTGSGIMRKDPTRKISRRHRDIMFMQGVQKGLLKRACDAVRPGGTIVYATCSLEPEENEEVIDWALKTLDVTIEPLEQSFISFTPAFTSPLDKELDDDVSLAARIHPHTNDSNAMFIARLKRRP